MTAREFFFLVAQMREAQRNYFADRTQMRLRLCKALESEVDGEIARTKSIIKAKEQQVQATP